MSIRTNGPTAKFKVGKSGSTERWMLIFSGFGLFTI